MWFWNTELCSAYQRGEVWTGYGQGVMDLQWYFLPVSWLWTCISPEWREGRHRWFFLESWLSAVVCSCPVWWPIQTRQSWLCREQMCKIRSAAPEAGWTSWAGTGTTPTLDPGRLWIPETRGFPQQLCDPLTGGGCHIELDEFGAEDVRDDGVERRAEVHKQNPELRCCRM